MNIAIILPFFHVGGVERWAMHASQALRNLGHEVTIYIVGDISAPSDFFSSSAAPIRIAKSELISLLIGKDRPELILTGLSKFNFGLALIGRMLRIPTITSIHLTLARQATETKLKYHCRVLVHRVICRFSSAIVCVSAGVKRELIDISPKSTSKIWTVYNPCFTKDEIRERMAPSTDRQGPIRFVAAGRMHPQKGFDLLIEAYSMMPTDILRSSSLTIYGSGELTEVLRKQSENIPTARINFPGDVKNLPIELRKHDVFILSSRYEGFGNVLAEALAAGCECIAFDAPHGPSEILQGGKHGTLVPPQDTTALSFAMVKAAQDLRVEGQDVDVDPSRLTHLLKFTPESFAARMSGIIQRATERRC